MPKVRQEELAKTFAAARKAAVKTVLDVVIPGPGNYLAQLGKLLPHVDVFLPNDHEGQRIAGEADPLRQAEVFRRLGAGTVVVTMGERGALLVADSVRLRSGVYPVDFVDGSGGGDAFDAGFLFGLLNNYGPEDCLRVASALGASSVRAIGTTPAVFPRTECAPFLPEHTLPLDPPS